MDASDAELTLLENAIAEIAQRDAARVVAEAREEAQSRVREALTDAFVRSLRAAVEHELEQGQAPAGQDFSAETGEARHATGGQADEEVPAAPVAGGDGTYVYGVVWVRDVPLLGELTGLGTDGRVTAVVEDGLAAVTSRVPLAEFEEEELRSRLSDIEWVERVARAHEGVLDDLCARTVVIPMRMCTVYRTEDSVCAMLRREAANLKASLEMLDGKLEWGLKVLAEPDGDGAARGRNSSAAAEDARAAGSGSEYLARRRAQRDEQTQLDELLADAAGEIHESLSVLAHESLLNPTQRMDAPGTSRQMVLNAVYLVARDSTDAFHDVVQELQGRFAALGLEFIETGPWPPYNFVPGDVGAAW